MQYPNFRETFTRLLKNDSLNALMVSPTMLRPSWLPGESGGLTTGFLGGKQGDSLTYRSLLF